MISELDNAVTGELLPAGAKCEGVWHSVNRWNRACPKKFSIWSPGTLETIKRTVESLDQDAINLDYDAINKESHHDLISLFEPGLFEKPVSTLR